MKIGPGHVVSLQYELRDDAGALLETRKIPHPLTYTQGSGQVFPELEAALVGRSVGETIEVTLSPAQGFGEIDPQRVLKLPRSRFPAQIEIGQTFEGALQGGGVIPVRVTAIGDTVVTVDGNHPFAGKHLRFKVSIVGVRPAEPEILSGDDLVEE